jgi:hypothetical protein
MTAKCWLDLYASQSKHDEHFSKSTYCTEWSAVKEACRELTAVIGISPSIDIDEVFAE